MSSAIRIWALSGLGLAAALVFQTSGVLPGARGQQPGQHRSKTALQTPEPLRVEHQRLHEQLRQAQQAGGKTGEAAWAVAEVMRPHFETEERIAMPPLGLLSRLSRGEVTPDMREVLPLTDELKKNLEQMLEEHREIVAALKDLESAATEEDKPEVVEFTHKLILHARMEEEVLYPAAILVGDYVRAKLDAVEKSEGTTSSAGDPAP